MLAYRVTRIRKFEVVYVPRVSVEAHVLRESEPSSDYLLELRDPVTNQLLVAYAPFLPGLQWFDRTVIYREVLAQAYEYTTPRMGVIRWPVISESASNLRFNVTEGDGGSKIPTVPASVNLSTRVDGQWAPREAVIVEKMDDGLWRVAGHGFGSPDGVMELELEVTTSGIRYAIGIDEHGVQFSPFIAVSVGQRIRPTRFAGWVYEITEAGTLPASEPQWWRIEGENPSRPLGTARAVARRYYRPQAHGPVAVEIL